jgi:hypothetical protein
MSLFEYLASVWRTFIPVLVGVVSAYLAKIGLDLDEQAVELWLAGAFTTIYYGLFRYLEGRLGPQWGWLLGLARAPQYKEKGEV